VQKQLARAQFHTANIFFGQQFDSVDWDMVKKALNKVPQMFQIWACKQVMNIAPTIGNRPLERDLGPLCRSCNQVHETCGLRACPSLQPLRPSRDYDALDRSAGAMVG
jgi:hypothetical protein